MKNSCDVSGLLRPQEEEMIPLGRKSFPDGFIFGVGSSAYQVEGGAKEGGRGPSIWDTFSHDNPDKIDGGHTGDIAVDSYHRYKEDVEMLKKLGVDAYRFSISWPRILPTGSLKGGVNSEGIDYYNNLINELLANGIQPFVTLFHWDVPQGLEDEYGGFLSSRIVDDFKDFAEICFRELGDRVKHWMTLNEPWIFTYFGYDIGIFAPGRSSTSGVRCPFGDSAREPYIVTHNLILSHAAAVAVYKQKFQEIQKGEIGITLVSHWMEPYTNTHLDEQAAERALEFMLGWYMEPLTNGDYPFIMKALVRERLPSFTENEKKMVKGSFDFIGMNYYTSRYASFHPISHNDMAVNYDLDSHVDLSVEKDGIPIGPVCDVEFLPAYPEGLKKLLLHMKDRYNNPKIYITENGTAELDDEDEALEDALNDEFRVTFLSTHLTNVLSAVRLGANVRGYFVWTLMDNFEWNRGFAIRFGLLYIDYKNSLKRHPKSSFEWFASFLKQ